MRDREVRTVACERRQGVKGQYLRELLHEELHVRHVLDRLRRLRLLLKRLKQRLHILSQVAVVVAQIRGKEFILVRREDDLLQLLRHVLGAREVHSVVGNAQQLVDHRLMGTEGCEQV